jgi:hypothetical protein
MDNHSENRQQLTEVGNDVKEIMVKVWRGILLFLRVHLKCEMLLACGNRYSAWNPSRTTVVRTYTPDRKTKLKKSGQHTLIQFGTRVDDDASCGLSREYRCYSYRTEAEQISKRISHCSSEECSNRCDVSWSPWQNHGSWWVPHSLSKIYFRDFTIVIADYESPDNLYEDAFKAKVTDSVSTYEATVPEGLSISK